MTRHARDMDRIRRNPGMGWQPDAEQEAWDDYLASLQGVPRTKADSYRSGIGEPERGNSGAVIGMGLTGIVGTAVGFGLGAWLF